MSQAEATEEEMSSSGFSLWVFHIPRIDALLMMICQALCPGPSSPFLPEFIHQPKTYLHVIKIRIDFSLRTPPALVSEQLTLTLNHMLQLL